MFWMFLANAIGMVTMFGFFFYLLLITQKGGLFGKAQTEASGFFCSFFSPAGRRPNNCSLWLPGRSLVAGQKSRRTLRLFALWPSWYLASAAATGLGKRTIVRSGARTPVHRARCRGRASESVSVSHQLFSPGVQVIFERTFLENNRFKLLEKMNNCSL